MRKTLFIVIACLGVAALFALDQWQISHWRADKTQELDATTQLCRTRLKNSLAARLDALNSLASLFVLHPETTPKEFSHFASQLMQHSPPIRALQFADAKTRIKLVFPPRGNEITIQKPMVLLSDPERGAFVRKAIDQKRVVLQGPFGLRQGGMGIVARLPIFDGDLFLGLSIGVYDLEALVTEAFEGIDLEQFDFQLSDSSGSLFWGSVAIPEGSRKITLPVADTTWILSANWSAFPHPPVSPRILVWGCGAGVLFFLLITNQILQYQKAYLEKTVRRRTEALSKNNDLLIREIAERAQTEEALKQSEDRLNAFLNNSPVGLGIWDREFRYVFINDVLQKINGPSKEAHIGKTIKEVLPEAAPIIMPVLEQVLSEGKPAFNLELSGEVPSRPGEITHYLVSYFPISMTGHDPQYIGGMVVDITDRKRAEDALLLSNRRYQKLFHDSPVPLWEEDFSEVYDYLQEIREKGVDDIRAFLDDDPSQLNAFARKIKILNVNQATLNLHKAADKADLLGNLEKLFTEKSLDVFKEEVVAIASGKIQFETEGEVKTLDGEPRQVYLTLSIDKQEPNQAKALLATVDITHRKQAVENIRQSEERLTRAQEAGEVGVWELDLNTQAATFSETFARIHGVEQLTCSLDEMVGWVPENDQSAIEAALRQALEPGGEYNLEHHIVRQDTDEVRWVRAKGRVTQERNGESLRMSGTTQDITRQKQAEQERDHLQRRVNHIQRMESIGNLAGGIAHDFNNILSAIIGFTELALEEADKESFLEDYLQEVFSAGKRAKDLVKQILVFARQSEEQLKPLQVSIIAEEALKLLRSSIPTTIRIENHIITDALVMGNATQLHQVFMNLCTNAAQAMEDHGGILKVSVTEAAVEDCRASPGPDLPPGDYINISVSDTGVGISPKNIESIFEPYFTSKAVGEGTGMGLAVVHGIIESYGGRINVESMVGRGTKFTIFLPISKTRSLETANGAEPVPAGNERILFIDDEAPIARLGGRLLGHIGYSVTTETSSIEALSLFRSKPEHFDLVITDLTMPNMTGDSLAEALMDIRPDIPVILCSGYSKHMSEERARRIGIKAFVLKPMVKAHLAQTVRKVLDGVCVL